MIITNDIKQNIKEDFLKNLKLPEKNINQYTDFIIELPLYEFENFIHIIEMISDKKLNSKPYIKLVFDKKIIPLINNVYSFIEANSRKVLNKKIITKDSLNQLVYRYKYSVLVCRSQEYPLFFDILSIGENKVLLLNLSWFEKNSGFVYSNLNLIVSCLLYSFTILFRNQLNTNLYELFPLTTLLYTLFLNTFGRNEGLAVATKDKKEYLFFMTALYTISKYMKDINSNSILAFLRQISYEKKVEYFNSFIHNLINEVNLVNKQDTFSKENFDSLYNCFSYLRQLSVIKQNNIKLIIEIMKYIGLYGITIFIDYSFVIAFILASNFPSSHFRSIFKSYSAKDFITLSDMFAKKLNRVNI